MTTTLLPILEGMTTFDHAGIRYATHVGEWSGQTWFRWQFSAVLDEFYDVMYFDQTPEKNLRYLQTVTPGGTVTYPESISYGASNPSDFEVVMGHSPVEIVGTDGVVHEGTVGWLTTSQRAGDVIHVASRHTVSIATLPADLSYIETWVFDSLGPVRTMGPGWSGRRV